MYNHRKNKINKIRLGLESSTDVFSKNHLTRYRKLIDVLRGLVEEYCKELCVLFVGNSVGQRVHQHIAHKNQFFHFGSLLSHQKSMVSDVTV